MGKDSTLISLHYGFFCEQYIRRGRFVLKPEAPENTETSALVDQIRSRLISKHVKGQEKDWDVNPVYGKGHALCKCISWSPDYDDGYIERTSYMFFHNFWNYLPKNFSLGLPREYGGLGLGLWRNLIPHLPLEVSCLIRLATAPYEFDEDFRLRQYKAVRILSTYCNVEVQSRTQICDNLDLEFLYAESIIGAAVSHWD